MPYDFVVIVTSKHFGAAVSVEKMDVVLLRSILDNNYLSFSKIKMEHNDTVVYTIPSVVVSSSNSVVVAGAVVVAASVVVAATIFIY